MKFEAALQFFFFFFYYFVVSGVAQHLKEPKQMCSELEPTMLDL